MLLGGVGGESNPKKLFDHGLVAKTTPPATRGRSRKTQEFHEVSAHSTPKGYGRQRAVRPVNFRHKFRDRVDQDPGEYEENSNAQECYQKHGGAPCPF